MPLYLSPSPSVPHSQSLDQLTVDRARIARQIALAMYGSDRTVESLPIVTVYETDEVVRIVPESRFPRAVKGGAQ